MPANCQSNGNALQTINSNSIACNGHRNLAMAIIFKLETLTIILVITPDKPGDHLQGATNLNAWIIQLGLSRSHLQIALL